MAKNKRKAKLPKRFAGVKIPKSVRKGPIGDFITSPAGQLMVAEVVAATGGALLKRKLARDPGARRALRRPVDRLGHAAAETGQQISEAGVAFTFAIGEAARSFSHALRHASGEPEPPHTPAAPKKSIRASKRQAAAL